MTATTLQPWLKVTVHHPVVTAEAVSQLLFDEGAEGVWEDQPDGLGRTVTRSGFSPDHLLRLEVALPALIERVSKAFTLPEAEFEYNLELEENFDWAEKWKEGLEPVSLGPHLAVAPTWWPSENLPRAEVVLRLDPGLAFGSGHHASTCLCLDYLIELAPGARSILDVGFGSGILALAAAALNPEAKVQGLDNDPNTLTVARENAQQNNLLDRVSFTTELKELSPPFDLLAANITLGVLEELAPVLTSLGADDSLLILSGLLTTQVEEISGIYGALGWKLKQHRNREEWSGLLLART